ncbi:Nuclear transport factor 2 [Hirschfeldia incana]|nr:Nuclear transport factor 2 [Hirschfeldia incana]
MALHHGCGSLCKVSNIVGSTSLLVGSTRLLHLPKSYPIHCNMVSPSSTFGLGPLKLHNKGFRLRSCRVKREDKNQTTDVESVSVDEDTLKIDLDTAIQEENYMEAARIRDILKELQEDSRSSVLSANTRFYQAFRNGDLAAMQSLWSKTGKPCCVHPGAKGITGYDDVVESWEVVWMNYEFPLLIELKDVEVHVRGEVGYVTCMEFVKTKGSSSWGAQFVSNVFEKIDGEWFICIHHASPVDI